MPTPPDRPRVTLVAALARNRVIGSAGHIPWHLPEDFRHFKATTLGHVLVMGRATYESIGRPLPGRRTVVLTRSPGWSADGVKVAHSLEQALAVAADHPDTTEVFVAGGGQVYAQAMPLADRMVLSHVDVEPEGDAFFPEWVADDWREVSREHHDGFDVATYERD